jgi:hypothetical protein
MKRTIGEWSAYLEKLAKDRKAGRRLAKADARLLAEMEDFGAQLAEQGMRFIERNPELANYLRGCESPEHRSDFRAIGDSIKALTLDEALPRLRALKHVNKKPGRKTAHAPALVVKAERLVDSGLSIPNAARAIVGESYDSIRHETGLGGTPESIAKWLARKFQKHKSKKKPLTHAERQRRYRQRKRDEK